MTAASNTIDRNKLLDIYHDPSENEEKRRYRKLFSTTNTKFQSK